MLHHKKQAVILLAGLAIAVAGNAQAQSSVTRPRLVLQALDTDHDGSISAAEIKAAPQSLLALDRNGDGQLTADELQPRPENAGASADDLVTQLMSFDKNSDGMLTTDELPARMQNIFQRGDADHDSKLTPDEIRAMASHQGMPAGSQRSGNGATRMDPLLNALDTDHDGVISGAEIAAADKSLATLDKDGDGNIKPDEMHMRQQTPQERVDHMLDEWDTNRDGKISKAEAPDRMQQQFESIDTNGDGLLDKEELLKNFSAAQQGGPAKLDSPKEQKQ
jgi:Ca2+-binding EF-hand superfamily protein